jgi:hypothetical protein
LSKSHAKAVAEAVVGATAVAVEAAGEAGTLWVAVVVEAATPLAAAAGEATVCRWAVVEEEASAAATLAEAGDISVSAMDATIVMAA